jgi:hypothetical protein
LPNPFKHLVENGIAAARWRLLLQFIGDVP